MQIYNFRKWYSNMLDMEVMLSVRHWNKGEFEPGQLDHFSFFVHDPIILSSVWLVFHCLNNEVGSIRGNVYLKRQTSGSGLEVHLHYESVHATRAMVCYYLSFT